VLDAALSRYLGLPRVNSSQTLPRGFGVFERRLTMDMPSWGLHLCMPPKACATSGDRALSRRTLPTKGKPVFLDIARGTRHQEGGVKGGCRPHPLLEGAVDMRSTVLTYTALCSVKYNYSTVQHDNSRLC